MDDVVVEVNPVAIDSVLALWCRDRESRAGLGNANGTSGRMQSEDFLDHSGHVGHAVEEFATVRGQQLLADDGTVTICTSWPKESVQLVTDGFEGMWCSGELINAPNDGGACSIMAGKEERLELVARLLHDLRRDKLNVLETEC